MNDKVNVKLIVPEIDEVYDILLPINKKMGTILKLLNKSVNELSNEIFPISEKNKLYNCETLELYDPNKLLFKTDIRNGTKLVLLSS